jgi:acylphosphatase
MSCARRRLARMFGAEAMTERIVRVVIVGRVQGVGFRAFVEAEAERRGLRGWVRNRRDGAVEAVIGGERAALEDMLAACRRGPPAARVSAVDVGEADEAALALRRGGEGFSVLATA